MDVSFNYLTEAGTQALQATGVNLLAEYQIDPADDVDDFELDGFEDEWE